MKRTWIARTAVAATAVAVLLTGCGAADTTVDEGEQTLRLSLGAPPSNFSIGNWSGGDTTLLLSIYDSVLSAKSLDGEITGGIADEWEYNEDLTELTLHIREGQTFTNGEVVDADAVVASLEVSRTGPTTSQNLASVASLAAPDDETVVITLSQPDAALVPSLADFPGAIAAPASLGDEDSQLWPIGSGAYVLDEEATTVGASYTLVRNDDNWNVDAYPYETVEFQIISDNTALVNAVKAGQLDYTTLNSTDQMAQFPSPDFSTGNNPAYSNGVLWIVDREGTVVPALADVRVRQAINMAFDREAITAAINPGINQPTAQVLNPTGGAWSEEIEEIYEYDVEGAKALLAEAGYPDGFALTTPSTFVSLPYEPVITQALADIGIEVTWETVPFQDFLTKVFAGNYGMFFMANAFRADDALDVMFSTTAVFNPLGLTTPEFEELMAEANASQSEDAFLAVNEYMTREAWAAPLFYTEPAWAASSDVVYTPGGTFAQSVLPWSPAGD